MSALVQRTQTSIVSYFQQFQNEYDSGQMTTAFTQLSKFWPLVTQTMKQYANRIEMSAAIALTVCYRKAPFKLLYYLGVLTNLSWLRHYICKTEDRLSGSMRFNIGYSVLQRFVKMKGYARLHIPLVGTFQIETCFDSIDDKPNTALTSGATTAINRVSSKSLGENTAFKQHTDETTAPDEKDTTTAWRQSFDTVVVPELLDFWNYRKDEVAHAKHRDSLESVVSQIHELKPYLQVKETVYSTNESLGAIVTETNNVEEEEEQDDSNSVVQDEIKEGWEEEEEVSEEDKENTVATRVICPQKTVHFVEKEALGHVLGNRS